MFKKTLMTLGKKVLSLALIFNFVVSLVSSLSILCGQYLGTFRKDLYKPYLVDSSLFWFIALTSTLNIVPARMLGKVNIRRILFHHYVYGFLSLLIYIVLWMLFSLLHIPNLTVFPHYEFQSYQSFTTLFLYWGITLIIDDAPDISPRILHILNRIRREICKVNRLIMKVHLVSSFVSIYIATSIFLWHFENDFLMGNYSLLDFTYILLIVNLFITALYGLKIARRGTWLKYF